MFDPSAIRARLFDVRARIARAAGRARRDPSKIRLVAVSKTFTADDVRVVAEAGQVHFGESKVQEALLKMDQTADLPLTWHLVGHLQTNKASRAASRFHVIHTVDSEPLLLRLDDVASAASRPLELLIQVDLAGEPAKHGMERGAVPPILAAAEQLRTTKVTGLMLLPPFVANPEDARPYFARLRMLRDELALSNPGLGLQELSMGMSHDFEVAVEEGATIVRVGSAIFGDRPARAPDGAAKN